MSRDQRARLTACIRIAQQSLFVVASPQTAVVLLLALAALLVWGTVLEVNHGAPYARWYVYGSVWMFVLPALLGLHSCCVVATRWPWQRQHAGFILMHLGLLALLAGAAQTRWSGIQSRVSLAEGETADHLVLDHGDQLRAFWVGKGQEEPLQFTFKGGPADWPSSKTMDLGGVNGVSARVLAYHSRATARETWIADEHAQSGPAVEFSISNPAGMRVADGWLVDQQFGDAVSLGPIRLQLQQAVSERMVEDFLTPPQDVVGDKGRLTMYLGDEVQHVAVDGYVCQKVPLGAGGIAVEIAAYLPNAVPDRLGNFTTKGEQPKNPMLELRVHLPGEAKPMRQIAFAKDPLLNLDGIYSRLCPVKFRYEHPAVRRGSAVELLQTCDGKLLGRLCVAGQPGSARQLHAGEGFELPGPFQVQITGHIPHAKRRVTFMSRHNSHNAHDESQPAAFFEITSSGKSVQFWLRRDDPAYGQQTLATPGGELAVTYEAARAPLGFSLKLEEANREMPAGSDSAIHSSIVWVIDPQRKVNERHVISEGLPLNYRGLSICQSSPADGAHRSKRSNFLITCDPGRSLKYAGGLSLCAGLGIMFATRFYAKSCCKIAESSPTPSLEHAATSDQRRQEPLRRAA